MNERIRSRRDFCKAALLAGGYGLLATHGVAQQNAPATLRSNDLHYSAVPEDFTGLSYESPQLYNPKFFSPENHALIDTFRKLSPRGVLRLGGNLSDMTLWKNGDRDLSSEKEKAAIERGKTYWEWKLTDMSVREHRDGAITPDAIYALRGFLDATNWKLIYGLNFGSGSLERAADEAACVSREIGERLTAFQVGNEADFFAGNRWFRERSYNFETYLKGYDEFVQAVRAVVSGASFAGPDTANNLSWVSQFSERASKPVVFLSSHHYAMGPAQDPQMNAQRLLSSDPSGSKQIDLVREVTAKSGIPFRMTEGNSCYGGGKPDVSDAFASALWGADYMLTLASAGYAGVNLHGGGDGIYTPIETLDDRTATPRPLYFGMQFAERFAGHEVARVPVDEAGVTAFAGRRNGHMQLAVLNKGEHEVSFRLGEGLTALRRAVQWKLTAPSLDSKEGVAFSRAVSLDKDMVVVAPYSAVLLTASTDVRKRHK